MKLSDTVHRFSVGVAITILTNKAFKKPLFQIKLSKNVTNFDGLSNLRIDSNYMLYVTHETYCLYN